MDWKVLTSAFWIVLLAEMGDKTQLAAVALAASSRKPWQVWAGAIAALAVSLAVAVGVGAVFSRVIPPAAMRRSAAVFFVLCGVWLWFR